MLINSFSGSNQELFLINASFKNITGFLLDRNKLFDTIVKAGLHMLDDVQIGDYILIHTGFALQKISEEEALETLKLIKELQNPDNQIF